MKRYSDFRGVRFSINQNEEGYVGVMTIKKDCSIDLIVDDNYGMIHQYMVEELYPDITRGKGYFYLIKQGLKQDDVVVMKRDNNFFMVFTNSTIEDKQKEILSSFFEEVTKQNGLENSVIIHGTPKELMNDDNMDFYEKTYSEYNSFYF